jgi:hypothetical protein
MSAYPEHDRQAKVVDQTQAIGEFLEWLTSQGVQLMVYREDLTDERPTDFECSHRRRDCPNCQHQQAACAPVLGDEGKYGLHTPTIAHCQHWQYPEWPADRPGDRQGYCCRCGRGQHYTVTGIRSWIHEQRGTLQLLADWAGIDLAKIEAEKRQMLAAIRSANEIPAPSEEDCGGGLGAERCRAAEDGDLGD